MIKRVFNIFKRYLSDSNYRLNIKIKYGLYNYLDDESFLKKIFLKKIGMPLNLNNPQTFNEKLQWLKLHDRKDVYTSMVDKYEAKTHAAKIIGNEYIIKTLGLYNNFDEINFDLLPDKFVIKCTHDSGGLVIVKDKTTFDKRKAKRIIDKSLKRNYYYVGREWPYKNVLPRIIIEEYIEDEVNNDLIDYKIMCFNGQPKVIFTCTDRYSDALKVTFFDLDWNKLPFERHYKSSNKVIAKPKNLKKMLDLSRKLSKGIPFVRIDWYEVKNKLYFGEYTFYPGSGFEEFRPEKYDLILGKNLDISDEVIK